MFVYSKFFLVGGGEKKGKIINIQRQKHTLNLLLNFCHELVVYIFNRSKKKRKKKEKFYVHDPDPCLQKKMEKRQISNKLGALYLEGD